MQWFIVHTLSGSEKKAQRLLQEQINSSGLSEKFGQILIPTENVSRIRGGKRQIVERQLYDLARDPGEECPGAWQHEDEAEPLLARIEADPDPAGLPRRVSEQGRLIDAPKVDPATDAESLARLQALGYVHGVPAAASSPAR